MSSSGGAMARKGAMARSPASASPAKHMVPKMMSWPCTSAGIIGIGGAGITTAISVISFGAASDAAMNASIVSGVAGSANMPAVHRLELVQPEGELGGHAEVAATAADRPEQVGMVVGVDVQHPGHRR